MVMQPARFRSGARRQKRFIMRPERKARRGLKRRGTKNQSLKRGSSEKSTSASKDSHGRWSPRTGDVGVRQSKLRSRRMASVVVGEEVWATACLRPLERLSGTRPTGGSASVFSATATL